MSDRECGDCSLCCKLPSIADLGKPTDTWCQFCKPGKARCTIYDTRPEACRKFECEWLKGHVEMVAWRPTIAKMMISVTPGGGKFNFWNITVDTGFPNRWREPDYYTRIKQMAVAGVLNDVIVRIHVGEKSWIVLPHADVEIPPTSIGFDVIPDAVGRWHLKFNYGNAE